MKKNKHLYFFLIITILVCCCKKQNEIDMFDFETKWGPDYFKFEENYIIDLEYKVNSARIYKIISSFSSSDDFKPNIVLGHNFFLPEKVYIIRSIDELESVKLNPIDPNWFQDLDYNFFNENILVLVFVGHKISEYIKNWNIINNEGKYLFKIETWGQYKNLIYIPKMEETLFFLKIMK